MRAVEITTDNVRTYIGDRQDDGASNVEINRELAALKRMFNLAGQQSPPKVTQRPYIPMLKEGSPRAGFFEHAEFLALRAALPLELRPVVTFGYYTGWRKREVLGMTWDRVDLQARTARLNPGTTKNDDGRIIISTGSSTPPWPRAGVRTPSAAGSFIATGSRSKTFAAPGIGRAVRLALTARCSTTFGARRSEIWSERGFPNGWRSKSLAIKPAPCSIATTSSVTATCARPPSVRPSMRQDSPLGSLVAVGLRNNGYKNGDSKQS